MRARRLPCCFLYVNLARNLGLSAIWRKNRLVGRPGTYCNQDHISLLATLCFGFLSLFHILVQYVVQRHTNTANTSVLGMVAKVMDVCDNVSCSTSFAQCVVQRGEKTVNTSVLGMDAMNGILIPPLPPKPNNTSKKHAKALKLAKTRGDYRARHHLLRPL